MSIGKIVLLIVGIAVAVAVGLTVGLRFGLGPAHRAEAEALDREMQQLQAEKVQAVREQAGNLADAVEAYALDGAYPASLDVFTSGRDAVLKPEHLKDAWGMKFLYRQPSRDPARAFDLCSAGPDRQFGTSDDICAK